MQFIQNVFLYISFSLVSGDGVYVWWLLVTAAHVSLSVTTQMFTLQVALLCNLNEVVACILSVLLYT